MSWSQLDPHYRELAETHLTPRQLQILRARLDGHSYRTIARTLNLDEATIRGHYERATRKLAQHLKEPA